MQALRVVPEPVPGDVQRSPRRRDIRPKVAWVASSFGYGDDLAYFRQVFSAYASHVPEAVVLVREDFPVDRYPDLPLVPVLGFWATRTRRRLQSGVVYAGKRRIPRPRAVRALWRLRARTVIVTEFTPTALVAWLAARLRGSRTVLLIESDPAFRGGRARGLAGKLKGLVARSSHAVLTSNRIGASFCSEVLGVRNDRLVIGPYVTSAPPHVTPPPPLEPDGEVRLLFLNHLTRHKGLGLLLRGLADVLEQGSTRWRLDVVGSGADEGALRSLAVELGLSDRVSFHGHVPYDEVWPHYHRCHVVLCASLGDYRSLAGFEAVNSGRAVLVSTRDGAADELHAAAPQSVRLVDPLDHPALVRALHSLTDPGTVSASLAAAAVPPHRFTPEAVGEHLARAVSIASEGA